MTARKQNLSGKKSKRSDKEATQVTVGLCSQPSTARSRINYWKKKKLSRVWLRNLMTLFATNCGTGCFSFCPGEIKKKIPAKMLMHWLLTTMLNDCLKMLLLHVLYVSIFSSFSNSGFNVHMTVFHTPSPPAMISVDVAQHRCQKQFWEIDKTD